MIIPETNEIDLDLLKMNHRYLEFLKHVSGFKGYGELVFPHCACSSRKNGHVIVVLSGECFKLQACSREGQLESQVVEFAIEDIERVDVDNEEMTFLIEVKIENRPNKTIKISTGFVSGQVVHYLKRLGCIISSCVK